MTRTRLALGILMLDLAATVALYARLPLTVPVHWGLHGADGFGPRWTLVLLGPGMITLLWLMMAWVSRIDPLASRPLEVGAPEAEHGSFGTLMLGLIALGALAHAGLLLDLSNVVPIDPRLGRFFGPALLLLLGNFLPRVRPNYFGGIRTPWTLSSPAVWQRTNRLAGKLLFIGGLLSGFLMLMPGPAGLIALVIFALAGSIVPVFASYLWWRKEQQIR